MDRNPEVFEGKDFQGLLKDIYVNSETKKKQIKVLMDTLANLINNAPEAAVVAPLVKDFLEVSVKNDEHLVKIATIMQRLMTAESAASGGGGISEFLSEDEKKRLLGEVHEEAEEEAVKELKKVFKDTEVLEELQSDLIDAVVADTKQAIESRTNSEEEEDGT